MKHMISPDYKYIFDDKTGFFMRWGKTLDDDPEFSPIGNEILDVSVSSICHKSCKFCYQSNTKNGKNMSFETFVNVIDKMSGNLCQIALATGDLNANPDIWKMMEYVRSKKIVPNITISGMDLSDDDVEKLVSLAGGIAVSHYSDDECYGAVKRLKDSGATQVNIHQLVSKETLKDCFSVMDASKNDSRLEGLNAIVFLSLKQKGRGHFYNPVSYDEFASIVRYGLENGISIGADSCSSNKFLKAIEYRSDYNELSKMIEPCEAGCYSAFVNVDGVFTPCSFLDGVVDGIDMSDVENYLEDVWFNPKTMEWRQKLLDNCRNCPVYDI